MRFFSIVAVFFGPVGVLAGLIVSGVLPAALWSVLLMALCTLWATIGLAGVAGR